MKPRVALSLGLSLILVTVGGEISRSPRSSRSVAVAASQKVTNGQIIDIHGDVQLQRANRRLIRNPRVGTRIYPGDRLLTAPAGQALIQCSDLTIQSVSESQVQSNPCPLASQQSSCPPGIIECPHRSPLIWHKVNAKIPYIIGPRQTKLLNDKPTLRWHHVPGATHYTVRIEGQGVNWTTQVNTTQVVYTGESPLQPGERYWLIVEADTGALSLNEPPSPGKALDFTLLNENQAQQVRAEAERIAQQDWTDSTKALALAGLYTENDLIFEAIETLEVLVKQGVETAPIYRNLGDLYLNELGLVPQAGEYYLKAIQRTGTEDIELQTALRERLANVEQALGNQEEALYWLTLASEGAKTFKDSEHIHELETQLQGSLQFPSAR